MSRERTTAIAILLVGVVLIPTLISTIDLKLDNQLALTETPKSIRNGPTGGIPLQTTGDRFWFQVGTIGDSSTFSNFGASVAIRTVYDKANDDAHSYWVGEFLGGGAFIQVGYLTTISTTGSPYCCAWFYEYFPTQNGSCCNPVIGPEFSAGPVGSWHTYKMDSNLDGTWSFYMDDKLLTLPGQSNATGTTPSLGPSNSGSGSNNAPAALAEVADASNDRDILGPGELRNLAYRATMSSTSWQPVPRGLGFKGYGEPSSTSLPNPYNSVAIHGVNNDLLAGSYLPVLPAPAKSVVFWPSNSSTEPETQFVFLDQGGSRFFPDWYNLEDQTNPTNQVFYTNGTQVPVPAAGNWLLVSIMWHNANVTGTNLSVSQGGTNEVMSKVYPVSIRVVGYLFSYPVKGAVVSSSYPDTVAFNATSDESGQVILSQLPVATYSFHTVVPRGLSVTTRSQVVGALNLTVRVVGTPELLVILVVPITIAILVLSLAIRRERARRKIWEAQMTTIPPTVPPPQSSPSPPQPPPS